MNTSTIAWIVVILIVLLGGWYVWTTYGDSYNYTMYGTSYTPSGETQDGEVTTTTTSATTTTSTPAAGSSVLNVRSNASVGQYLSAPNGMTLYTYGSDSAGKSNCTGSCAANWPPYTVAAGTSLGVNVAVSGALSTVVRADGSTQVTYKGMPLYFWVGDKKAGDVTGDKLGGFAIAKL